jgi:hypothetical protein
VFSNPALSPALSSIVSIFGNLLHFELHDSHTLSATIQAAAIDISLV